MSATQTTPGGTRRARPEKAYVPYNAQPKATGTRTGAAMPTNVPRMSDGFEDPDAFFRSPAGTEYSRTRKSMMSVLDTPATVASVGTSRRARGRMSQMLDDDDDEGRFDENLLADEDDLPRATPPPFFSRADPPSVSLPRASRLPPPSPAMSFGDIPSPAKSAARRSARRTDVSRLSPPPTEDELGLGPDEMEAEDVSQQVPIPSPSARSALRNSGSPQKRKAPGRAQASVSASPRKGRKTQAHDEDDEEEEPETGRDAVSRLSMASRRTSRKAPDSDGEEDDAGPSVRYDPGETQDLDDGDFGMDGNVDDAEDVDEDGDDGGGADPMEHDHGEEDDDEPPAPDMDDAEEQEAGSQSASASPVVKKRRGRPPNPEKRAASAKPRANRATSHDAPRSYKKRVSQLEDDDNDGVSGDFTVRRSGRKHFAPLAWWRGEKFNYQRGEKLPVIKEVIKIPEDPASPLSARYKRSRTGRSQSAKPVIRETVDPEAGWDAETEPIGLVREFPSGKEMKRRIAFPFYMLDPKESSAPGAAFRYQKVFGDNQFLAAGVIYLPVEGKKPGKNSKDNSYVFYVITGAVEVKVHRTSFVMGPGAMFLVPRGNHYSIENISETQVELFFAQARKLRADEPDEEAEENEADASTVGQ